MPEEEKEARKKFKAVTEELTSSQPSVASTVEENQVQNAVEVSSFPAVTETKNITAEHPIKNESGIFLKFFLVTFFATLLALALAGGVYVYLTGTNKTLDTNKLGVSQTPTPVPQISPTPISTPVADLSTFKVSVLNGNGGIGVASKLKAIIEKVGFKVSYTGNADNFNFTDTLIQVKSTVPESVVATLKNSLTDTYSVKIGDPLDAASIYDIVITVGSK